MPARTKVAIVTPAQVKFEGDAEIVVAPGSAGDIGALPNHAPFLTTLRAGVLRATVAAEEGKSAGKSGPRRIEYAINGGFLEILPDKVIVLSEVALAASEIDAEAARADLRRAEESLAAKRGGDDRAERDAVAWASARLEVARSSGV